MAKHTKKTELLRLQKYMAQAGVASRRTSEEIIKEGRVKVNDHIVREMGVKIDPRRDKVTVDGIVLNKPRQSNTYIILHKPRFVLSTTQDDFGRKTVLDLVDVEARIFPVGRLDFHSEGLILLTSDGDLAQKLTHPSFNHEREYHVLVQGEPGKNVLRRWRYGGFEVEGKAVGPMQVERLSSTAGPGWLKIILTEGRKRQIRVIAEELGFPVETLRRVRYGPLKLGNLKPGHWRYLTPREIDILRRSITLKAKPRNLTAKKSRNFKK